MVVVVYSYINRFVSPDAILERFRAKLAEDARKNQPGQPFNPALSPAQVMIAFIEFFDEIGKYGWEYCGSCDYGLLPHRGLFVFKKKGEKAKAEELDETKKTDIKKITDEEVKFEQFMRDRKIIKPTVDKSNPARKATHLVFD